MGELNQEYIDFCNYIQPIVTSCSGFARSNGYVTHIPGALLIMSADETFFTMINIPVVYNVYMTSPINTFLALKTPELQSNLIKEVYFTGYNIKANHLINYYNLYKNLDDSRCIYYEPDCYNIAGFNAYSSDIAINSLNISTGQNYYRIPVSKSITPLNKGDSVSLKLYNLNNPYNPDIKVLRYTLFKKKFKFNIDIYCNILCL